MKKDYECSICGKQHVKLWRPYMDTEPLICASCAEVRQSPLEYDEVDWKKAGDHFIGEPTGKRLPLPKWKVDDQGLVPPYTGPRPSEVPLEKTSELIVDLHEVCKCHSSGKTSMIPAIPTEDGAFWGYTATPDHKLKWWQNLPTR